MRIRKLVLAGMAVLPLVACAEVPTATQVLRRAEAEAKASQRNVMLIYHASWCGWCHKLDHTLAAPQIAGIVNKAYVIAHVTVMENDATHMRDMNAGGMEQLKAYGGGNDGIPFFVILNPEGRVLGTSKKDGAGNIGYPGEPAEIDWFMKLMGRSTPMLSDAERGKVEAYLRAGGAK